MSIPYNNLLSWNHYSTNPTWHVTYTDSSKSPARNFGKRSEQCLRDTARLVLKVPARLMLQPLNWQIKERSKINAKLAGYSVVLLVTVSADFFAALFATSLQNWISIFDGRTAQLEALKEVGTTHATTKEEFELYKTWLYTIDPLKCRAPVL